MRLWSLHPKYLDTKGLLAVWREGLLAQSVLQGSTQGYRHHPQLHRFKAAPQPAEAIAAYLAEIANEADQRGYTFNRAKIGAYNPVDSLPVTAGQVAFEREHLLSKLQQRDPARAQVLGEIHNPDLHPLFRVIPGEVESWEIR